VAAANAEVRAARRDHRQALRSLEAARAEVDRASEAKEAAPYGSPAYERESYNLNVALSRRREARDAAMFAKVEVLRAQGATEMLRAMGVAA